MSIPKRVAEIKSSAPELWRAPETLWEITDSFSYESDISNFRPISALSKKKGISLSNGSMAHRTFSDGHVTKQFIRGLVNKENVHPTQLSSETFIVEEAPKIDETVIKDNLMYGIQNTMLSIRWLLVCEDTIRGIMFSLIF